MKKDGHVALFMQTAGGSGKITAMLTQTKCKISEIKITYFFVGNLLGLLSWSSDHRLFGVTIWYCKQNEW
jgi:hypothetical protein